MSEQGGLFAEPEPTPAPARQEPQRMSAVQRRAYPQAQAMREGLHPLSLVLAGLGLHPEAPRNAARQDPDSRVAAEVRCGSCAYLRQRTRVPWCGHPLLARPGMPAAEARAWWPGCEEYERGNDAGTGLRSMLDRLDVPADPPVAPQHGPPRGRLTGRPGER